MKKFFVMPFQSFSAWSLLSIQWKMEFLTLKNPVLAVL